MASSLIAVLGTPLSAADTATCCAKVSRFLTQAADHDAVRFLV
ncbi:hypothetical protein ABZ805_27920 [Saccharopolyspora sp. NPDC047091]